MVEESATAEHNCNVGDLEFLSTDGAEVSIVIQHIQKCLYHW